jgi:DNA-binding CsgD family transcriptional regulator
MHSEGVTIAQVGVPLLTAWGASPDADLVFRFLAEHGPQSVGGIRRALGTRRHKITAALDELVDCGAVTPVRQAGRRGPDARMWHPRPPAEVVAILRERRLLEARARQSVRRRLATLSELDPALHLDSDLTAAARPLHGLSRTRARLGDLVHATRHEHLSMHPEPAFDRATVQASASLDHDLLARKVSVLTLGVPPSVEDVTAAHALELTRSGMEYRELPTLPAKMILFDRRTALLPLDPFDTSKGALEVVAPTIVESLARWYLRRWDEARPPKHGTAAGVRLTPRERRIVVLLAAGHTDASAAAQLGLSERTVAYAIHAVMERHGVHNRYQLGLVLGAAMPSQKSNDNPKDDQ